MFRFIKNLVPIELKRAAWSATAGLTATRMTPSQRLPSTKELLGALSDGSPMIDAAKLELSRGNLSIARKLIVRHFRDRPTPRFFSSPADSKKLAETIAGRHPEWRDRAVATAREILAPFLACDGRAAQRLWRSPPLGPGRDKLAWHKPHQLPWAAHLARACAYGIDAGDELQRYFGSWLHATDGIRNSPAYADALIAVHRGANLTWALHFLRASEGSFDDLEFDMLRVLLTDVRFVYERLGQSFPNNHLLADGFFCWYVGVLYPEFGDSRRWLQDGQALWEQELSRQVLSDGTSFEHSLHYHEVVCEMLTAYIVLSIRNDRSLSDWVVNRARNMLSFQSALGGPEARTTCLGDGFEDYLFPLDDCSIIGSGSHREVLRHLYQPLLRPLCVPARGMERALWLTSALQKVDLCVSDGRDGLKTTYPRGGVFVLNNDDETRRLVFRTGPTESELIAPGHMHADLLSVNVIVDSQPILIDPGTYCYRSAARNWPRGTPPWRAHFMSPDAHNGPCIPGIDPLARGPGDFPSERPLSRVHHDLIVNEERFSCVSATITGTTPYRGHRRTVLQICREYWIVIDRFPDEQRDAMFLNWQCAPAADIEIVGNCAYRIGLFGCGLRLATANLASASVHHGETTPLAGWVSDSYGALQAAACLRFKPFPGTDPTVTVLMPGDGPLPTLALRLESPGTMRLEVELGSVLDVVALDLEGNDDVVLETNHLRMLGNVCWYRQSTDAPVHAACAGQDGCDLRSGTRRQSQLRSHSCGPIFPVAMWSRDDGTSPVLDS